MARIDFYVLDASGPAARNHFACRLAEKAYKSENSVYIQVPDADTARQLDDLLWTFRDGSFVPHEILGPAAAESPVLIGTAADTRADLLINLTADVAGNTDAFPRVAEIVTSDDESKSRSRAHFASYRDAGHTLQTHKL
jgi:DNA polymerase III subunit chi